MKGACNMEFQASVTRRVREFFCFFLVNFYWRIVTFQRCVSFLYTVKWMSCVYAHIPLFRSPSHLGCHGELSRGPCAMQQALISYFIHSSTYTSTPISQFISPRNFNFWKTCIPVVSIFLMPTDPFGVMLWLSDEAKHTIRTKCESDTQWPALAWFFPWHLHRGL